VSFAHPDVPPAPPPPAPLAATGVVLHRDGPEGREVLLVRRGAELRFAGGFHAFPGGRLDPEDHDVPVAGASGTAAALVACATRELFEEAGVLLAAGAASVPQEARVEGRRRLLDGTLLWGAFLRDHGLSLSAAPLSPAGRWITPETSPLRYDASFFLAELPPGERAEIWPGELAAGGFVPAARVLARWERGEILLHPPQLHPIRLLARDGDPSLEALRDPPDHALRIEFQSGILLAALRTPTLPPATHTNAWIVEDGTGVAVVDPGAPDPAEQARLFRLLDALAAEGRPPRAVWLTHLHPDHVGAAPAVAARYGVPVRAHRLASGRIPAAVEPLREGDLLGGRFLVLETPGHAPEHLVFLDERTGALLCGDLVSTISTVVIDPPEGDMAEYVRQLERIRALAPRTLYPAHGPPAPDAVARLSAYLAHRREREGLVVAALAAGRGTLEEVTGQAYLDTPGAMAAIAERSCLAVLEKLRREGRAREGGGRWSPA
jgi:endoribonuclease LACTB2